MQLTNAIKPQTNSIKKKESPTVPKPMKNESIKNVAVVTSSMDLKCGLNIAAKENH